MGTRNLTIVVADGMYKVAQYCQWDGYPSGQGDTVLKFLKNRSLSKFKKHVLKCEWATEQQLKDAWVEAGAKPDAEFVSMEIADQHTNMYPEFSRDTGAGILDMIQNSPEGLLLQNELNFAADSLFCEYAYVIDLDNNKLEVYTGFNEEKLNHDDRFYFLQLKANKINQDKPAASGTKYQPIKMKAIYDFDDLPTVKQMEKDTDPEEEEEGEE